MSRIVENGILTVLFFLVVNVVFLNIFFLSRHASDTAATTALSPVQLPQEVCDDDCQEKISEKIQSKISDTEISPKPSVKIQETHEFIIPLGIGSTDSKEYTTVPGVETYIDTSLYPQIKYAVLETYMSIPTANGFAFSKLYNATDKHDVWFSEQSMETNVVTLKQTKITLDKGRKLYKLMMKSTMGYEAKLNNSRIRIITE